MKRRFILSLILAVMFIAVAMLPAVILSHTAKAAAPANAYWVGGSGDWTNAAVHWATESGGDPSADNLPDETTNVHFDENSFDVDHHVVSIADKAYCHNMDWTGSTNDPVLTWELGYQLEIYGDCTFASGMTINSTADDPGAILFFKGNCHLTSNGVSIGVSILVGWPDVEGVSLRLQDALTMVGDIDTSALMVLKGGFYTNDYDTTITALWEQIGEDYTIDLGSSTVNITSSFDTHSFVLCEGGTLYAEDSTIIMSSSGVFDGAGFTYGNVSFKGESLTVNGSNTYKDLSLAKGVTQDVTFESGTTQTMTMAHLSGSAGHIHTIHTYAYDTIPATFTKSLGGTIPSDYINISYITASPENTWCNGSNSIKGDGCLGWVNCSELPITFPDPALETAVRNTIGIPGEDIYQSDLNAVYTFEAVGLDIEDLTGMEYWTTLTYLDLSDNNISDILYLSSLTSLGELNLSDNSISDISPLVGVLDSGDYLDVRSNTLNHHAYTDDIPMLEHAGVTVDCDPEGGGILADAYWVGGSGDWSDAENHWSNKSGGTPNASFLPDLSSAVHFDANSFSEADQTVNIDKESYCGDMTWVGADYSPSLIGNGNLWASGNITMISDMSVSFADGLGMLISSPTTANFSVDMPIYFDGMFGIEMEDNGSVSLQSDLNISDFFVFPTGILTTNNYNISASYISDMDSSYYKTYNLGSSIIHTTGTGWYIGGANTFVNAGTSTIIIDDGGSGGFFFGGGETYHNVTLNGSLHAVVGDNTIENFSLSPDITQLVYFGDGTTQTVASASLSGSDGHIHTLTGTDVTGWNIVKSGGGTVSSDYIDISYSNAYPANTWCYGTNSVEGDGCSGWVSCDMNSAPTITSVTLQQSDKTTATSAMTPQTAYNVEIVAGDADTINDINKIDISIFYDANAGDDGTPAGAWDCDQEAIYRWAKSGSTWSMQNSSAVTTWSITTGSCDTPANMSATSGEWNLYFTVGKLAVKSDGSTSEWDVKVMVTDSVSHTVNSTIYSKSMGSYASLSLSNGTINFGSMAMGSTTAIQTPSSHYVTLQSIANSAFALGGKSSSPWTNGSNNVTLNTSGTPGAAGEFALTYDDAGDGSGHPTTPQAVTTSTATITGHNADVRTSTAADANESTSKTNMYMDCKLYSSSIPYGTYSGTITFTITIN